MPINQKYFNASLLLVCSTVCTLFQFRILYQMGRRAVFPESNLGDEGQQDLESWQLRPKSLRTVIVPESPTRTCAINLYGLPRAFESLALPALIKNVIRPNAINGCDYFVHYYYLTEEMPGRSGDGGRINPNEVVKLKQAVQEFSPKSVIQFRYDKEQAFWDQYQPLIEKIRASNDTDGKFLYFPWRSPSYVYPITTDNIVKMWHSVQSAWSLMTLYETLTTRKFDRVAMLRLDVVYITPINVFQVNRREVGKNEKVALIPGFGRHPVSDRLIIGPREAIEIWASQRFDRLEEHVKFVHEKHPGWGMHSEMFLHWTIFPAIRDTGTSIVEDDSLCFFRARADESVWVSDCGGKPEYAKTSILKNLGGDKVEVLESVLGRKCRGEAQNLSWSFVALGCPAG